MNSFVPSSRAQPLKRLLLVLGLFVLIGCTPPAAPRVAPTGAVDPVTEQVSSEALSAFRTRLASALAERDYPAMEALMGETFLIEFGSGVFPLPPSDALGQIRNIHLIAGPAEIVEPEAPLDELLDLVRYEAFWAETDLVKLLLSEGWGSSGDGEGLLIISRGEDGELFWYGLLIRPLGFPRLF